MEMTEHEKTNQGVKSFLFEKIIANFSGEDNEDRILFSNHLELGQKEVMMTTLGDFCST